MAVKVPKSQLWKAIKEHCLECSGGSAHERKLCPVERCPLWPYRNGHARKKSTTGDAIGDERHASGSKGRARRPNFLKQRGCVDQ